MSEAAPLLREMKSRLELAHLLVWVLDALGFAGLISGVVFKQYFSISVVWIIFSTSVILIAAGVITLRVQQNRRMKLKGETAPEASSASGTFEKLDEIAFNYLPNSPFSHGWVLHQDQQKGSPPIFSAIEPDAPVVAGLSIKEAGWYGMDYTLGSSSTLAEFVRFASNMGINGTLYTKIEVRSRDNSTRRYVWLAHRPGSAAVYPFGEGTEEWSVHLQGRNLGHGWLSFEIPLADEVKQTFGRSGWVYSRLVAVRLRGSMSLSAIEFYRKNSGS